MGWLVFYAVINMNSCGDRDYVSWVLLELCVLPVKLSYIGKSNYKNERAKGAVHRINIAEFSNWH